MTPEDQLLEPPLPQQVCYGHPDVPTGWLCSTCARPICETCTFDTAAGRICPDCITAGPSAQQRRSSAGYAFGSLASAAGGVSVFIAFMLMAAQGDNDQRLLNLVGYVALGLMLTGLALGLVGREHSRRTGSPLALIGAIANGLLLALYLILMIVGLASRK